MEVFDGLKIKGNDRRNEGVGAENKPKRPKTYQALVGGKVGEEEEAVEVVEVVVAKEG